MNTVYVYPNVCHVDRLISQNYKLDVQLCPLETFMHAITLKSHVICYCGDKVEL